MKGYIKSFVFFFSICLITPSFAAGALDHFEVILGKESAKVGEALDITISAVDKNNEIITDYTGDILVFSESDKEAEFPNDLSENSYSFTTSNEGSVKFENAVQFKNAGKQDVYVYDLNDENILGLAEVTITENQAGANLDIEIQSPENGITIGQDSILVSGTTQKNYQVRISVNNSEGIFTTTNDQGVFEKKIEDLQQGANSIQAFVLDADDKVVGESKAISVKVDASLPSFKSITITPEGNVAADAPITITVVSSIGLTEVQAIIDDAITVLEEGKDGIYTGKSRAPKVDGKYGVDIIMKDEFAHEVREANAATLIVSGVALNAGPEEAKVETIEPNSPNAQVELDLKITGIELTELKTKSILTWDAVDDAKSYNVYKKVSATQIELVENVLEPRYEIAIVGDEMKYDDFAIKAVAMTASGETIQGDLSEMTKVQTGPGLYILLALLAFLITGGVFYISQNSGKRYS
ncbi:hypothetical protein GW846_01755 [Candidatus Gracilibacteria bacterium]|nr:hypothetical protein [Candidatus Gracilibacteria bacterium]